MKKCPFCAEEIQDAAIKCKHCGEWLKTANAVPPEDSTTKEAISANNDRICCPDESCIGTLNPDGICSECGRSSYQIENGVISKVQEYAALGSVPLKLLQRLRISAWTIVISFFLSIFINSAIESSNIEGGIVFIFLLISFVVMVVANIIFMVYIGKLSILLNKSPIFWVGGCFILFGIFHIFAYYQLTRLATTKILYPQNHKKF